MLWLSINYWPAMRLAFEIILALPALLFAAAFFVGLAARRKQRKAKGRMQNAENRSAAVPQASRSTSPAPETFEPAAADPADTAALHKSPPAPPQRLRESDFEAALIAVEQARARGDHAAAEQMLASLHGQAPAASQ